MRTARSAPVRSRPTQSVPARPPLPEQIRSVELACSDMPPEPVVRACGARVLEPSSPRTAKARTAFMAKPIHTTVRAWLASILIPQESVFSVKAQGTTQLAPDSASMVLGTSALLARQTMGSGMASRPSTRPMGELGYTLPELTPHFSQASSTCKVKLRALDTTIRSPQAPISADRQTMLPAVFPGMVSSAPAATTTAIRHQGARELTSLAVIILLAASAATDLSRNPAVAPRTDLPVTLSAMSTWQVICPKPAGRSKSIIHSTRPTSICITPLSNHPT